MKEKEADSFAESLLIPDNEWEGFLQAGDFSGSAVLSLTARIRISPGLVVGRMQHEEIIPYSRLRHLINPLDLTSLAAA